jgi:hypothetical protein
MTDPTAETHRRRRIRRGVLVRVAMAGNVNAARHLVYSTVAVSEDIADVAAGIFAVAPWLQRPRDELAVTQLARIVVRLNLLHAAVDADPSQILTSLLARLEAAELRSLESLGLTPTSAARLGLDVLTGKDRARRMSEKTLDAYRATPGEKP